MENKNMNQEIKCSGELALLVETLKNSAADAWQITETETRGWEFYFIQIWYHWQTVLTAAGTEAQNQRENGQRSLMQHIFTFSLSARASSLFEVFPYYTKPKRGSTGLLQIKVLSRPQTPTSRTCHHLTIAVREKWSRRSHFSLPHPEHPILKPYRDSPDYSSTY